MQKVRTFVYIDGFNLYYGSVKDNPYKWLDLKKIGLFVPGYPKNRRISRELRAYADFIRPIRPETLKVSQLLDPIPGTSIHKPPTW